VSAIREGGLDELLALPPGHLRRLLLSIRGIGPETADAIVLYAAGYPTFVVDTYTRRFASRHGLAREKAPYDEISALFAAACGGDAETMGELHALLVELGKRYCRPAPACGECPLRKDLDEGPA
jgi:endonuclease-3 related protein